ncbi:hypothetical protein [Salinifilum ghardaiensis]
MNGEVPAAIRYKELTALAATAAERLRRHENARAAELEEAAADASRRIEEADAQLEQVRADARKRWNAALEALWHERWFQVDGGMPEPDPHAPPQSAEESRRAVQEALLELHEATAKQKRRWKRGKT